MPQSITIWQLIDSWIDNCPLEKTAFTILTIQHTLSKHYRKAPLMGLVVASYHWWIGRPGGAADIYWELGKVNGLHALHNFIMQCIMWCQQPGGPAAAMKLKLCSWSPHGKFFVYAVYILTGQLWCSWFIIGARCSWSPPLDMNKDYSS